MDKCFGNHSKFVLKAVQLNQNIFSPNYFKLFNQIQMKPQTFWHLWFFEHETKTLKISKISRDMERNRKNWINCKL